MFERGTVFAWHQENPQLLIHTFSPKNKAQNDTISPYPLEFLPSKRFGITAVFILAAFAGWFFIFGPKNKNPDTTAQPSTSALISIETTGTTQPKSENQNASTDESEKYLRLEGIEFAPSRLESPDKTASSTVAAKQYGIALTHSLALYSTKTRANEVVLLLSALDKGSAEKAKVELLGLQASTETHKLVKEALMAQKVPDEFRGLHAALITSVSRIEQLTRNMQGAYTDPVLALASAQGYVAESEQMKSTLGAINDVFTQEGITFSNKEKATVVLYEVQ